MPIAFSRYISITSGLGAGAAVQQRELIARFFTLSSFIPTKSIVDFDTAADVASYFGADSEEFRRANFYFGFVSKSVTSPNRVSFARWANADTAPLITGSDVATPLAIFNTVTAGEFVLTLGAVTETVSAIDLQSAADLATVASTIQTAVRAANVDVNFAQAVVSYNAVTQVFTLTGGATGPAAVDLQATASTPVLADLLGWTVGVRLSAGVAEETVSQVLTESTEMSNNFGSFAFVPTLSEAQVTEAGMWNDGNNVLFQYHLSVLPADAAAYSANLIGFGGIGITLGSATAVNEYPEVLPMAVLAATNYNRRGAVQNYMFQQSGLSPTVTTTGDADLYDSLRINYYGSTQTAGQTLAFYQRGVLTGTGTDPVNMNTFANEQWLKDFAGSRLMALLLALPRLPANAGGRGQALAVLREVVSAALNNGTISIGRTLSAQQRVFIAQQTGDPNAFQQVQTSGYWLDAVINSRVVGGIEEFFVLYTLVYSKDNVVRSVDGTHTLI